MALVVSSAPLPPTAPIPTAALQTALTNFESALTTEQKRQFHDQIQSYNQQRPDASSVIEFVARIDATNHGRTRKSVSSRLCTFIEATRQFTDIVDTFVSSNPLIAARVWGGIKATILIANNVASYFDKVTKLIVTVGQLCPIYREFSYLYNGSTTLQQALCEYYAVVVRLLTKVVQVSQRPIVTGILSSIVSPFESDFGPFQHELAEASQKINLCISLAAKQAAQASARLAELESRENSLHRKFARKIVAEIRAEHDATRQIRIQESARRAAKTRLYVRDQLSTINPHIPWKQAQRQRLANTAEWFRHKHSFQAWKADPRTAMLWCPGRMGVGKTVLVSNIIAHLHTSLPASHVISYHFCRSENSLSLLARDILGTLARQILDKFIEDAHGDQLQHLRNACQDTDTDGIVELLSTRLEANKRYYIIVDGLDECTRDQIADFATSMAKLCKPSGRIIKLLYSCRPELEHQLFQKIKPKYRLPLSKAVVNADIERYIDTELDHCLERGEIKLLTPEAICTIRDVLYTGHDGLLLFVRLFIEEIRMLGNESAILKALETPPKKISDLFAKRLNRVQAHDLATDAMKILRYCGCTKRPMTVNELSELLSLSVSQPSLDRASIPQNMDQIVAACCGLIYVEEDEATVHYVHYSLRHHLFTSVDTHQEGFDESETDIHLGHLCLTYLNFNDFKREVQKFNAVSNVLVTPIELGLAPVRSSSSMINEIARKLLRARNPSHHLTMAELTKKTKEILSETQSSRLRAELHSRPFHLLDYVQYNWIWHSSKFDESSKLWHRFSAYVRGENDLAKRPWIQDSDMQSTSNTESPSKKWALIHNHAALLLYDLLHEPCLLSIDERLNTLKHAIVTNNHHLAVAMMNPRHRPANMSQHGLFLTASCGRENFLELFISAGADVSAFDDDEDEGELALTLAARGGHLETVERLLGAGADINASTKFGGTALLSAAERGRCEVVKRLLGAGADVNASAGSGGTALQGAALGGHLEVVERLLAAGANVNASTSNGYTALQAAAGGGHLEVVERLLAAGAKVDAYTDYGPNNTRTALRNAAQGGHYEVVERLKRAGACG